MLKKIFFCLTIFAVHQIHSQTVVFNENFETTSTTLASWVIQDLDNDGRNWVVYNNTAVTDVIGFSGRVAKSESVDGTNGTNLSPNNLLVSPIITLGTGNSYTLNYQIGSSDDVKYSEHYAVYVLPSTTTFTTFLVPILEETISVGKTAINKKIDLTSFAGKSVKIYFRHFNSTGQNMILLDNVSVVQSNLSTKEFENVKVNIYPNPTKDYITIDSKKEFKNIEILDSAGRKLTLLKSANNRIDVSHLSKGIYYIKLEESRFKFLKE